MCSACVLIAAPKVSRGFLQFINDVSVRFLYVVQVQREYGAQTGTSQPGFRPTSNPIYVHLRCRWLHSTLHVAWSSAHAHAYFLHRPEPLPGTAWHHRRHQCTMVCSDGLGFRPEMYVNARAYYEWPSAFIIRLFLIWLLLVFFIALIFVSKR